MLKSLISIQYCYDFLVNQISLGLLLYSHIPTALLAIFLGFYLVYKKRDISTVTLFITFIGFAAWALLSISTWFSFLGAANTMFTWSLIDLSALVFFFFAYYFLYAFVTGRDLPVVQKVIGTLLILPTIIWTFLGYNLTTFDANVCEAWENSSITIFPYYFEAIILATAVVFWVSQYFKTKEKTQKRKILLAGIGVTIFLSFFLASTFAVSVLVNYSIAEYAYNFEIYGLFGMPLLLAFLTLLIVRYRAFDIKLVGAQALVVSLVVLIGSQFLFTTGIAAHALIGVTLIVTGAIGINLIRSVKKEVAQREQIEKQEKELEHTNAQLKDANVRLKELDKQKTEFLGFASHQLRGPLTPIKGYAESILAGDFGKISEDVRKAAQVIFDSTTTLAQVVDDYLNVTRIELGKLKFEFAPFNLREVVQLVADEMKPTIEKRGLKFNLNIDPNGNYEMRGDKEKINNQVITNLIDNSLKYTPRGEITVSLGEKAGIIRFSVKDTGVGIAPDVLPSLFTKFKRAANANKTNIHGTGLGLYIAKDIATAHKGKIWAESEGEGKGSEFIVELPR